MIKGERAKLIVENAHEAIIVANEEFKIIDWNPSAEKIFGWKKEEALKLHMDAITPMKYRGGHIKGATKKTSKELKQVKYFDGLRKNGSTFPIELRRYKILEEGKDVYVASIVDRTKEVESDRKLEELTQKLSAEKEDLKSRLALKKNSTVNYVVRVLAWTVALITLVAAIISGYLGKIDLFKDISLIVVSSSFAFISGYFIKQSADKSED